ncbi:uncharacterized protein LOC119644299 [Glossina fuscipes]|uniref:Uncharacterized protein LOC119641969 n=1 Tax=Glossina fuscipes TaxID=7396 RepID=A0A9C5ZNM7_9MUSC|nr:uncharacterized protein LOC119641969 [Glossina fuscipes]XP_037899770.1 uncharacterized protein LOC119644299 [Glossina fuscipes]
MAANTALGLWLDCVSCCFLISVTFSFIVLSQQTYSGNVGLAISQAMILTGMVQSGVRQVAESLKQMILLALATIPKLRNVIRKLIKVTNAPETMLSYDWVTRKMQKVACRKMR